MKILAVDTATSWQSVALVDGETIVARSDQDATGSHARTLMPAIDRLLTSCGMTLSDLEGLAVSIGPGSFTGLRVGLATMMGFRQVTGLPLALVPTLEAMAWNLRGMPQRLCPMLRARTGEIYWAQYQWLSNGSIQQLQEEQVGAIEVMARSVQVPTLMFGEGWTLHKTDLHRLFDKRLGGAEEAPPEAMRPSAVSVGRAGAERIRLGKMAGQGGLAPRYVQRPEAEIMWEHRGAVSPTAKAIRRSGRRSARTS